MYVIIWEYQVKAEQLVAFEEIYASNGAWAELFKKEDGYISTELLHDSNKPQRYITIDRWTSLGDYESFRSQWKSEYARVDAQCEGLTEQETLLGRWESILPRTR
jgi:heme-degrading monooxygenase HmoA